MNVPSERCVVPAARGARARARVRARLALWAVAAIVSLAVPADRAEAQTVDIPDPNLRAAWETALGKASGDPITCAEIRAEPSRLTRQRAWTQNHPTWDFGADPPSPPATVVRDLTGMECGRWFTKIWFTYNRISDLSPLAGLIDVDQLHLSGNLITDLSPLARLTKLHGLTLGSNLITDLSPLAGLRTLHDLSIYENQISDLSPLAGLRSLRLLAAHENRISDLSPLAGLTELQDLSLHENQISDLSPLAGLTKLRDLTLANNPGISDLSPLQGKNLRVLDLNYNRMVTDVSVVAGMTNLTRLSLNGTGVADLKPLVDNSGLAGSGVYVYLRDAPNLNADAETHIATLRARGVNVFTNSQLRVDTMVQGVRVRPGVRSLTVTWRPLTAQTGFNPTGYRTQWRGPGNYYFSTRATPPRHAEVVGLGTTSYTISDLTPGTEYYVRVRAHGAYGTPSASVPGTPLAAVRVGEPGGDPDVVVTPGVKSLTVSWEAVDGAAGYKVQWKSGQEDYDPGARQATADGPDRTRVTIGELTPGVEYTVRVIATTDAGAEGAPSDEATGTPLRDIEVNVKERQRSLEVSWRTVPRADSYRVQWRRTDTGEFAAADAACLYAREQACGGAPLSGPAGSGETVTWTITGLDPDVEYYVAVTPMLGGQPLANPDDGTGTPLRNIRVDVVSGLRSLEVSWRAVPRADSYRVQWRRTGTGEFAAADAACVWVREEACGGAPLSGPAGSEDIVRWTITGLEPDVEYHVAVTPMFGGQPLGNPGDDTGTPFPDLAVDVVPGLRSLEVSWRAVPRADRYRVQWRRTDTEEFDDADAACVWVREEACGGAPLSGPAGSEDIVRWTITGLEPDVEYHVAVTPMLGDQPLGDPSYGPARQPHRNVVVTIMGGDGAGVGKAIVVEGDAAELTVMLDGPSGRLVTVSWRTEDDDTVEAAKRAKADVDYLETAGRLTFQPGDVEATLRVPTRQDRRVEPAETFRVELTKAVYADLEAASATVTITDDDTEPARGRALGKVLAGMGRWIAADAVEVIEGRLTGGEAVEAQVGLGGRTLPLPGIGSAGPAWSAGPGRSDERTPWTPEKDATPPALSAQSLARSRFNLPLGQREAGEGATGGSRVWGQGSAGGFEGRPEAGFTVDGEVVVGYLGVDHRPRPDVLVGVALSRSRGDVDYEIDEVTTGEVDLDLTSVLPYAHWSPRGDLELWGLVGAGWGDAELEDEAGEVETGLEMRMAAFGLRRELAVWREVALALKTDAFLSELSTDAKAGLPKASGDAERLRLRLEGRMQRATSPVSQLTPSLEVGGRWDGGDAETGMGLELGGGLAYAHDTLGLEVEARGRYLWAHRESSFDEWGGSLTAKLDPGRAGRGPWMKFAPGWGAEGSRAAQMWEGKEAFRALGDADEGPALSPDRLDLEVGWGAWRRVGGLGMMTPWAGLSMAGSRDPDYRLGARMDAGRSGMSLDLENRLSEAAGYEIMLRGRLDW